MITSFEVSSLCQPVVVVANPTVAPESPGEARLRVMQSSFSARSDGELVVGARRGAQLDGGSGQLQGRSRGS
jgi:hypothetical protein